MNITNPTNFGIPGLTLTTSNAEGTGNAIRTNASILAFDSTVPTTIAYSASPSAGVAAVAARRDHTHGMAAASTLKSTAVSSTRTAASGSGDQAITGAGFTPSTFVILSVDEGSVFASWGFGDDAAGEAEINVTTSSVYDHRSDRILTINEPSSSNGMTAVLKSLDSDGCTITWTKYNSGLDVHFTILFLV